jgi:hypothetical protein
LFCSDNLLTGFEVSTLVFLGYNIDGFHNNRVFSRCISNLILVINESFAETLQLDENLSIIIPIYGVFLYGNNWLGCPSDNYYCFTIKYIYISRLYGGTPKCKKVREGSEDYLLR